MSSRHELVAVYLGLKHPSCCWDNDDGTQTIVAKVEQVNVEKCVDLFIKGTIYPGQLKRDLTYRFYGFTKEYRGEDQFVFESFVIETPAGEDAVVAYLTQCNGIGPAMARSIFKLYGDNSVAKLREHPDAVADEVSRLTVEKAREASAFLKKSETTERSKMDILGLLKGRGFPKKTIEKLLDDYGAEASQVVARNPYLLMRYKGCGFGKTDEMYLQMGLNRSRMKRQALCAWHAVAKQTGGDTWWRFDHVAREIRQNISSASVDVERAMRLAVRGKTLAECFRDGHRWVAEYKKARDEERIAELVEEARTESAKVLWGCIAASLSACSEHQRDNAEFATDGLIGILGGRPGTGKTYTTAQLVLILRDMFGEDKISVAAPTGKAAVRVTAAMESAGLGLRATTLHSLLEFNGDGFARKRSNPLDAMFIIVDESSMIDTAMMRSLLEARREGSHILFVGDVNQLAPVGHGAPLRDMIEAGVPYGELREIRRNSGRIVAACGEIIDRSILSCSPKLDIPNGENLFLIERDDAQNQIDTLAALMQRFQRDAAAGAIDAVDPIWGVQIIVAVNDKSELGRKPLNRALQDLLNPDGRSVPGNPFRVGDKIINGKNGQYKSIDKKIVVKKMIEIDEHDPFADMLRDEDHEEETVPLQHYVANGEQAEVIEVDSTKIIARLTSPDRTILIPRSSKKASEEGDAPPDADDESTGSGCSWELGYSISCHKSQGSEWPVVIVMVDDYGGAKMVQSKQWIYTAISRAKRFCLLIGQSRTANQCCQRDALFMRKTFLAERIVELASRVDSLSDECLESILVGV